MQAEKLGERQQLDVVINLDVPFETIIDRISVSLIWLLLSFTAIGDQLITSNSTTRLPMEGTKVQSLGSSPPPPLEKKLQSSQERVTVLNW